MKSVAMAFGSHSGSPVAAGTDDAFRRRLGARNSVLAEWTPVNPVFGARRHSLPHTPGALRTKVYCLRKAFTMRESPSRFGGNASIPDALATLTRPRSATHGLFTATINDVAARAGVSNRTVGRVMNEEPNIGRGHARPRPQGDRAARLSAGARPHAGSRVENHISSGCFTFGVHAARMRRWWSRSLFAMASERYRALICSSEHRSLNAAEELRIAGASRSDRRRNRFARRCRNS